MRVSAFSFLLDEIVAPDVDSRGAAHSDVLSAADASLLALAWREGTRGVGRTAPNPAVGAAVALPDGTVVAGHHARAGDRHAEVAALDLVAGRARGATLACTLEPCVHHGRTPPCLDRILREGVARVVIGALDENPIVRGHGVARLRAAGVEVVMATGAVAARAYALAQPFFNTLVARRPYVLLKIASSLDGGIATHNGKSRWITGPRSRRLVHALRDRCDAVMVGAGTVVADDPALTVRDVAGRDPVRVVLDSTLRIPAGARALGDGSIVLTTSTAASGAPAADALRATGASLVQVSEAQGAGSPAHVDLAAALGALAARGIASVLVEAGPGLATALLDAQLVDELWWFQAPMWLGSDARHAIGALGLAEPAAAARWTRLHACAIDDDSLTVLARPL